MTTFPPEKEDQLKAILARALEGRFEVLRPVAIGGMATIFQLRHQATQGLFVAKIMHPELARQEAFHDAFKREARIGALLAGHPNAVPILDIACADDLPWLLMPYIEGEDLDTLLVRHGKLGREESLMLLAQICSLLMYAEREEIVHADVSLGNIRLDPFGQYRLFDYGLARTAAHKLEDLSGLAGTPASSSPEQLRGELLDIRSDLYSLGLLFFHTLTGYPAFALTDVHALAEAHMAGSWTMPGEFAGDLPIATLLQGLLATHREQRLTSAFQLGGAIAALGFELPSFARALPGGVPALPRPRRRRLEALQR